MFLWSSCLGISACSIVTKDRPPVEVAQAKPDQPVSAKPATPEVSLIGDRKTIEELRENIPEPIRSDNDLLKETLSLLGEVKEPPHRHQRRFDRILRRARDKHQKDTRKAREAFTKKQKAAREVFLTRLKSDREKFNEKKVDRKQRKAFYDEQDAQRKEFFADERDARRDFDSEMRAKNSDFNSLIRDREKDFRQELRVYKRNYDEMLKQKKAERQSNTKKVSTEYKPLKAGE